MTAPPLSATTAQIIRQLAAQLPPRTPRRLLIDGERPAWVHIVLLVRRRSMDVTYDLRRDRYDVAVHDLPADPGADGDTHYATGVYCDQLGELLASPPHGARPLFESRQPEPTVRVSGQPEARR